MSKLREGFAEITNPAGTLVYATSTDDGSGYGNGLAPEILTGTDSVVKATSAREITIRWQQPSGITFYEIRFRHPSRYNGSDDTSYWGPWMKIYDCLFVNERIAFTDIEFRNASGTFTIYTGI